MRGCVQGDVLVSTDWVADHLTDPDVRVVESNEDMLLYPSAHIPGAVQVDWTADLNDQVRRDYLSREAFEALASRIGITPARRWCSTATRTTGGRATPSGSFSSSAIRRPRS